MSRFVYETTNLEETEMASAGRTALKVFTDSIPTIVEHLKETLTDEKYSTGYADKIFNEAQEKSRHMFGTMYILFTIPLD